MIDGIGAWWVVRGNDREGPFTSQTLKVMIEQGSLRSADMIWKDGLSAPIHVWAVQGLLPMEDSSVVVDSTPPPTTQVDITTPLTLEKPIAQPDQTALALAVVLGPLLALSLIVFGEVAFIAGFDKAKSLFPRALGPIFGGAILFMTLLMLSGRMEQIRKSRLRRHFSDLNNFEFTEKTTTNFGEAMLRGAVLIRGGDDWPRFSLLRGMRRGHYFQAIDYWYGLGRSGFLQTVIAIRLRQDRQFKFAIVQDLLKYAGKRMNMVPVTAQPSGLSKGQTLLSQEGCLGINLPTGFLTTLSQMDGANVEVLGNRLIVYKLREVFTDADYTKWIDFAIKLENLLSQHAPDNKENEKEKPEPQKEPSRRTKIAIGLAIVTVMATGTLWTTYKFSHAHLQIVTGLVIAAIAVNAVKHLYLFHRRQEERLDLFVNLSAILLPLALIAGIASWLLR